MIDDSKVEGRVVVEEGAEVIGSRIRGPAVVGAGTKIINSYVGPYTSIYFGCVIEDTEIEHSVVLTSTISGIDRVVDSLVGKAVDVRRTKAKPKAVRLMLGDHSRVDLAE